MWKDLKKKGKSTWIDGEKGDAQYTAWLNLILMHGILHDDMQETTVGHLGSFVIPAAYGVAEQEGKGGKDLLPAIVAGYEVAGKVAMKSGLPIVKRGFRASPVFGPFAAATVAGKLMGLSREQMQNAVACAASFSCGLLEAVNSGSMEWRFQNGGALRNGRWLEEAGVAVPRGPDGQPRYKIEINPLAAHGPKELKALVGRLGIRQVAADLYIGPEAV